MAAQSVSVVMAVRNGGALLREAIASVHAQTYPAAEIIVVDGSSVDDTVSIALAAGARVVQQRGATLANAYNTGIEEATGSHIAFLSYDDLWWPNKTELQLALLAATPSAAAAIGVAEFVLLDGNAPRGLRRELLNAPRRAQIAETLLAPRSTFERVGPFRAEVSPADDTDWFARFADLGLQFVSPSEVILTKRLSPASTSHSAATDRGQMLQILRDSVARKRSNANLAEHYSEPPAVPTETEVDGARRVFDA